GHLPRAAAEPRLHREGGRHRRLALGWPLRLRRGHRLARRGVSRPRRALRAPWRPLPGVPGGDAPPLVRPGVGLRGLILRPARIPPVSETGPAAAPADLLRR